MKPEGPVLSLDPNLSQFNPVHTLTSRFSKINFKYYHPIYIYMSQVVSSLDISSTKMLHAFLLSLMHATCSAHFILFPLMLLPILYKEYKLQKLLSWSSVLTHCVMTWQDINVLEVHVDSYSHHYTMS